MKAPVRCIRGALALQALSILNLQPSTVFAEGTVFTDQVRRNDAGVPANGSYDLRFFVCDNSAGGSRLRPILTNSAMAMCNGLFTLAPVRHQAVHISDLKAYLKNSNSSSKQRKETQNEDTKLESSFAALRRGKD